MQTPIHIVIHEFPKQQPPRSDFGILLLQYWFPRKTKKRSIASIYPITEEEEMIA